MKQAKYLSLLFLAFYVGRGSSFFWFTKKKEQPAKSPFDWTLQMLFQSGFAARLKRVEGNYIVVNPEQLCISEEEHRNRSTLFWIEKIRNDSAENNQGTFCHIIPLSNRSATSDVACLGVATDCSDTSAGVRVLIFDPDDQVRPCEWILRFVADKGEAVEIRSAPTVLGASSLGGLKKQPTETFLGEFQLEVVKQSALNSDSWLAGALRSAPEASEESVGVWAACLLRLQALGANLTLRGLRSGETLQWDGCAGRIGGASAARLVPASACGQVNRRAARRARPGAPASSARGGAAPCRAAAVREARRPRG